MLVTPALLLLLAAHDVVDEVDPRSPEKPLTIVFKPYYCPTCVREKRIEGPDKEIRLARLPAEALAKSIDLPKGWIVIESPNFKILSTLDRAKVKLSDSQFLGADLNRLKEIFPDLSADSQGAQLNAHQRAHLYHIRAERIFSHFRALTENSKKYLGMMAPYEFYLFEDYDTHHRLVDRYMGLSFDKMGAWHHQRESPNFFMFSLYEALAPGGDRNLSNHFIHSVAHNLVDGCGNYYRESWAWLEEGLAHYYERREQPNYNTFCWTEGKAPALFEKPDWNTTLLNMVRRGKDPSLSQWCEKLTPGELLAEEQGVSWSLVKWLVETEPVRFAKLVERIDDLDKKPTASQCIELAFGVSPGVLHQRWREYVLKEYAKR